MILSLWDEMNQVAENFKEWIIEHSSNPLLWVGLFLLGLLIFAITYKALQKEK